MNADPVAIALRLIGLVSELWPAFGELLEGVSSDPLYAADSVAQRVRAVLPGRSECEEAAETLREGR